MIVTFLLVTIVLIAMQFITENPETELYLAEHKNLVDDWNQQPIVDVIVVDGDQSCPEDYEPLLNFEWPGTHDVCKQSGVFEGNLLDQRNVLYKRKESES